ncbi:MAG: type IV pilus twitching motility protein PilT [Planctomycetes bacterium]|nr:type IV pilus twitching motility protein PilT [Planctomycetota bacterium]MCW8137271.1 type IV pilus twitching motility protein PilT [Planctomycetota bacterium]
MSIGMQQLLDFMVSQGASDLHLSVGRKPTIRKSGHLKDVNAPELTPADTVRLCKEIIPEKNLKELQEAGSSDWGYAFGDKARFRCAAFKQKNVVGMVMRQIPNKLLTFEQIGLPENVKRILDRPRGLILVTGPTGSGKTTTLATMIDFINTNMDHHIITIEDPIEYYHPHKKSIVTQRELHNDVPTFSEGLRRALRQDPDVILVGEMRDLETIGSAITAAETGHLVFGTLHTTGATRTVDRIIDAFPTNQQEQVRAQLAVSIIAIISQAIMPKVGGGLIAAFEIMVSTSAVENLIREAKTYQLNSVIQTGKKEGMVLLDDYLWDLYNAQKITRMEMFRKCSNQKEMREKFEAYRKGKGKLWDDHLVAEEEGRISVAAPPPAAAAAAALSTRQVKK